MTYDEALEATVSYAEARAEFKNHGQDEESWREFQAQFGVNDEYAGADVLGFLGY